MDGRQKNKRLMLRSIAVFFIRMYQRTLSPDHSWVSQYYPYGYCRFHPTCSEYAAQAITKYGILRGSFKGVTRLIRCHPWAEPRIDHVD